MNTLLTTTAGLFYFAGIIFSYKSPVADRIHVRTFPSQQTAKPAIQAAILLDVSNSMDGLIDQAKAQLWNMVSVMGRAKCNEATPKIEIALYEYGRETNDKKQGYVKQIRPFSSDLDQLSKDLFSLQTNGGNEYCGHVIYSSLEELNWDSSSASYKVIFIAGNEDFLQGDIGFTKACEKAKEKGVIVNTIYCGNKIQGVQEHWNLGGECGNGSYTNIDADAKMEEIETPYDSMLFVLNDKLNNTYIRYGYFNASYAIYDSLGSVTGTVDEMNTGFSRSAGLKRIAVKGNAALYKNAEWDLLDAFTADSSFIDSVELETIQDSIRLKSRTEIKHIVKEKVFERLSIQDRIVELDKQRDNYINAEKAKKNAAGSQPTLETAIEKIIKEQAMRFNMQVM